MLNPDERAASICPFSIEFKPPRIISAIIADSKTVSATMAETVILKLIPISGSAKYVNNMIRKAANSGLLQQLLLIFLKKGILANRKYSYYTHQ